MESLEASRTAQDGEGRLPTLPSTAYNKGNGIQFFFYIFVADFMKMNTEEYYNVDPEDEMNILFIRKNKSLMTKAHERNIS